MLLLRETSCYKTMTSFGKVKFLKQINILKLFRKPLLPYSFVNGTICLCNPVEKVHNEAERYEDESMFIIMTALQGTRITIIKSIT